MQDELAFNLYSAGYDQTSSLRIQPKERSTRIDGYELVRRFAGEVRSEPKQTTE